MEHGRDLGFRNLKKFCCYPVLGNFRIFFSVFNVVHVHLGTGENVIPVYGLLISVLKEAWNYAIFSPLDKELFNQWRRLLSDNLNT